ncbi:MORN repeat-containing protein 3 [Limanda limanda]|uniref:MORN repeat-containing protein 3 n=1 Tax=Limanda limanda TaxID=27771 RepID=UPI0029C6E177|nr:MORN repeat-containing protein 3 [Limanda limanda]
MPLVKRSQKTLSLSKLSDVKSQKCGLLHTVYSANGNEYTGEWQDNNKHGTGIQVWKKSGGIYEGEWRIGKQDGYGTYSVMQLETKKYERKYFGGWKNGKKHGYGKYLYSNSAVYDGEWSEDHRSGWGRMYYENGDVYEGEWMGNKCHGQGIIRFANGNWYEGAWQDGKKNGNGKFNHSDKGQLYEGFWVDGVAKCGTLSDLERDETPTPSKCQIPQIQLVDMELVLREAQSTYADHY